MHLSFVFSPDKAKKSWGEGDKKKGKKTKGDSRDTAPGVDLTPGGSMDKDGSRNGRLTPRLERRNAKKNIDYEAGDGSSSDYESPSGLGPLRSRSLDLPLPPNYASKTSFRIDGESEGEVIWRSLGLSGPEDFAIPAAVWEARKGRSSSDLLPKSRLLHLDDEGSNTAAASSSEPQPQSLRTEHDAGSAGGAEPQRPQSFRFERKSGTRWLPQSSQSSQFSGRNDGGGDAEVGIKGPRPPSLAPPPPISVPKFTRQITTPWDFVKSLAPGNDDDSVHGARRMESSNDSNMEDESKVEVDGRDAEEERRNEYIRSGIGSGGEEASGSGPSSFATSNEDDSPSTDASPPVSRFYQQIEGWIKGEELGRGSFGTVYKAIKDDGGFFAVKEVSLLDQGCNAEQSIQQLEQEIALLSNFKHENIVQYLGTKKEKEKLYIYLELVTEGSLASLYRKYHLRDSQVSPYTRQILSGLKYLHDRNVVHRDIKCANILVHANGSVKLADFGLAKEMTNINMLKSCKGSVYWMAPEVVKPQKSYGPAADIWSLGCTVLEMLTQKLPYPDLEWTQALFKIGRGGKPEIPDSLSKDAQDFIAQCVQVDPEDRPPAVKLLDHPFVKRQPSISTDSDSSSHGRRM